MANLVTPKYPTQNHKYDALEDCLQLLDMGESLDSCLLIYPHFKKELRPMLVLAQRLRSMGQFPQQTQVDEIIW